MEGRAGGVSGENKPFAALIESLSLAAAHSCQGKCLFTTRPLWESFFYQLVNVIKLGGIRSFHLHIKVSDCN